MKKADMTLVYCHCMIRQEVNRMKTDIEIAQEAEMLHIRDVAKKIGVEEDDLEFYGK